MCARWCGFVRVRVAAKALALRGDKLETPFDFAAHSSTHAHIRCLMHVCIYVCVPLEFCIAANSAVM